MRRCDSDRRDLAPPRPLLDEQQPELVAAEPADDVAGPGRLAQQRGRRLQQPVAGQVARASR